MTRRVLGKSDAEYPALLKEIPDPPELLYADGLALEPAPLIAVVGTRRPTPYGLAMARLISGGLATAGALVVSGMARGIDAAAHRGALEVGMPTVAVLGCGLDICYPFSNSGLKQAILESGTLLSEYEDGVRPRPYHFPIRNRIIAGMSKGVVIVEAANSGGAMITARLAMDLGREVMAIPGPASSPQSQGPHELIRDGAALVTSTADVLSALGLPPTTDGPPTLQSEERKVLECLSDQPIVLDAVSFRTGLPAAAAAATLSTLELRQLVTRYPGGRFARGPAASNSSLINRH